MQGEGEEVFSELIRFALEDKYFAGEENTNLTNHIDMTKLQKLQGIAVRDFSEKSALENGESSMESKSKIINTGFATLMNMDTIPFVYEDFHLFEHKILYYETSRGCPFRCKKFQFFLSKQIRRNLKMKIRDSIIMFHQITPNINRSLPITVKCPVNKLHLRNLCLKKCIQLLFHYVDRVHKLGNIHTQKESYPYSSK